MTTTWTFGPSATSSSQSGTMFPASLNVGTVQTIRGSRVVSGWGMGAG